MVTETFDVDHISCTSCERTIGTLLGDVEGVEDVTADHRSNTVAITYDEARVTRDALVAELTGIGYSPTSS